MEHTRPTAKISTTGPAPCRQHSLLAKRGIMNVLFDSSDTEESENTVDGKASSEGINKRSCLQKQNYTSFGISPFQARSEIAGAKRSLELAKNWNRSAWTNLKVAEERLQEAKNVVRDAKHAVAHFKYQHSETKKMLREEKSNLIMVEEKHSVINLESDSNMKKYDNVSGYDSDSDKSDDSSLLKPLEWSKTCTIPTKINVATCNSSTVNLS